MDWFSIRSAWSLGVRFFAGRLPGHAIVLIGLGVAAPLALQYAILGFAPGAASLAGLGSGAAGAGPGAGAGVLVVMTISYTLQIGSYFAAWRLGFGADRSLPAAVGYGLGAGLLATAVCVVLLLLGGLLASQFMGGADFFALLVVLVPVLVAGALLYTLVAALVATATLMVIGLAMAYGAAVGQVGLAATLVGGNGAVAVIMIGLAIVLLWLCARLSCATSVMAERRSFNLVAAARESWRLTWEDQWAIMRYLALLGLALFLLILAAAVALGAGTMALLSEGGGAAAQAGGVALGLAALIPMAFLTVMIPAGIYRSIAGPAPSTAEVFA